MEIQPFEDNVVTTVSETSNKRRRNTEKHARIDRHGSRIRIPVACAHGIYKLTHELGLRSDGETVLWLLEQVRPELVQSTVPLKTVPRLNSTKEKEKEKEEDLSSFRPNPIAFAYPKDCVNEKITALVPVDNVSVPTTAAVKPESESEPGLRLTVRATVVQASTVFYDTPATLDKAERLIAGAAAYGSELIVFPEAFVGGYPRISDFGSTERSCPTKANEELQKYYAAAIDVPGPEVDRLATIANKYKVHLVMGVVEREGSILYSTILFFDSQGQYLGKHRKLMRAVAEQRIWCQGDDSTLPLYKTPVGKIGGLSSWDNRMPLLRTELYAKGVEIYCMPTADASDVWRASMTHIAVEGGCFILSANQFCQRKDYPLQTESVLGDADRELSSESVVCAGGSVIISPSGAILAGPNYHGESLLSADLDLGEIARAKLEFNGVGHSMGTDSHSPVVDYHCDQAPLAAAVKVQDSWQL